MRKPKSWNEYPLVHRPLHPMADNNGMLPKRFLYENTPLVNVISDNLGQSLEHHGYDDGRRTDSKSQFRKWTREAGLVEKGNDREPARRSLGSNTQDVVRDVAIATNMVKNGYVPRRRQFEE